MKVTSFFFVLLLPFMPMLMATCETRPVLKLYSGYSSSPQLRPSVKVVQQKLNDAIGAGLTVDGYFGPLTRSAVRTYQSSKSLTVDGIVGSQTWASLCRDDSVEAIDESPAVLLKPFQCGVGHWPAQRYTDQVVRQAYNSGGKSYHDLAVDVGLATGVHPALLTTHMVLESQIGLDPKSDFCKRMGKTILTGCQWYPECSEGCGCSTSAVYSDRAQVECTAKTDKNAENPKGLYKERCDEYKGDKDKLWKCTLCTYQGNFYEDIKTDDTDDRYFARDKTCLYAENFKKVYCEWEAYFAQYEGI